MQKWDLTACENVRTDLRDKDKAASNKDEWTQIPYNFGILTGQFSNM